jgi:diguanylate cyclase (GGDEF)-like protein
MAIVAELSGVFDLGHPLLYAVSAGLLLAEAAPMIILEGRQPAWLLRLAPQVYTASAVFLVLSQSSQRTGLTIILLLPILSVALRGKALDSALIVAAMVGALAVVSLDKNLGGFALARTLLLWGSMGATMSAAVLGLRRRLAESRAELEMLAKTDPLTGLANRREFETAVALRRGRRPFAILSIDLDNMKKINDRFGHEAGDRLIEGVARACVEVARTGDVVARLGGDEFALFVSQVEPENAQTLCDRFRGAIASVSVNGCLAKASVGYAVGTAEEALNDVLNRADEAMYNDKRSRHEDGGSLGVVHPRLTAGWAN